MEITLEEDNLERFLYESSSRTWGALLNSQLSQHLGTVKIVEKDLQKLR